MHLVTMAKADEVRIRVDKALQDLQKQLELVVEQAADIFAAKSSGDTYIIDSAFFEDHSLGYIRELKEDNPGCKVIVLHSNPNEHFARISFQAGADYLIDTETDIDILKAIVNDLSEKNGHMKIAQV